MNTIIKFFAVISIFLFSSIFAQALTADKPIHIVFVGASSNDLFQVLKKHKHIQLRQATSPSQALQIIRPGELLLCMADGYPKQQLSLDDSFYRTLQQRQIAAYIEYPAYVQDLTVRDSLFHGQLERGIIASSQLGADLQPLTILGMNDTYLVQFKEQIPQPLVVLGKVAGLNRAEYGIEDVQQYPLLFKQHNSLIATSKLSNFATGRYGPHDAWKSLWSFIIGELSRQPSFAIGEWLSYVEPTYGVDETLPKDAKKDAVRMGVDWFEQAKLYVHPQWEDMFKAYQGDGTQPYGPAVPQHLPAGDGKLGMLEGHASKIYHDGSQQFRYWLRADVQGEAAFALAAAGKYLSTTAYNQRAINVIDYVFSNSNLRAEERNSPSSPSYGLIGWSVTHPYVYYGDDNARALLGMIGTAALLNTPQWDEQIVEGILANFRTTGSLGFRGERIEDKELQSQGWQHFYTRELEHYAPHFESWTWATYLWLYDKTNYAPLLAKTKEGIRRMMEGYPQKWRWTNGLQQERARMILVLSWLTRIENTKQHQAWLDTMVSSVLANQDPSGGIMEWLGDGSKGRYGKSKSNADYGKHEAPLIFSNGDPIADMLYTTNFAYFGLNEAYHATKNPRYKEALDKMSDFLIRIQVKSPRIPDLHGAWFRGFEYDKWEYWASNADAGWGAWGTLSGWTQSWIVATQVLTGLDQSFWDITQQSQAHLHMKDKVKLMLQP